MSTHDAELMQTARHEAGHLVATWYFTDRIVAVTLRDEYAGGCVWSRHFNGNTLMGVRQKMIGIAAGGVACGREPADDDFRQLQEGARQIVGLTGSYGALTSEIDRAKVGALWLVREYAPEIAEVARRLVSFHRLFEGFERRYADA